MRWLLDPRICALLYLALGCALVYGMWNTTEGLTAGTAKLGLIVLLVVAAQIGFGFAIGSWWALLLPYGLAVLAVPAGFPPSGEREPLQIWLVQAWLATPEALLMIPGILARKLRGAEA
jgi:disulfide bond formation protein DsbB